MPKYIIYVCFLIYLTITLESKPLLELKNKNTCNLNETDCSSNPSVSKITPQELCDLCYVFGPFARELVRKNQVKNLHFIATFICTVLNITEESICSQAITLFEVSHNKSSEKTKISKFK
jgi:hypothetical protein